MSDPALRLYDWDLVTLAVYEDAPPGTDLANDGDNGITDFIAVYTDARFRWGPTRHVDGRATSEQWEYPLPISTGWSVDLSGVVDGTLIDALRLATGFGGGPFLVWMKNGQGYEVCGRAIVEDADLVFGQGAQSQHLSLLGQGTLAEGHLAP